MNLALCLLSVAAAIDLDLNDKDSVNNAGKELTKGVLDYYDGNHYGGTVGVMSPPYYWWESASALNGIYTYSLISGDSEYDDLLHESLLAQSGNGWNFITDNQTNVEGNDDQGYWAMFAMEAAERGFKSPGNGKEWADLAKNVFDEMTTRWDPQCGGGLRWQIFDWNHGFEYKNTVSTGCMFNLASRLARYTNNQTYVDWAYKIYDWMVDVEFLVEPTSTSVYHIYDGAGAETNCTERSLAEWSYNYGLFISGMSYLHDLLETDVWNKRIDMAWKRASQIFFEHKGNNAMIEPSCQPQGKCNNDQRSFRASFARFLGHLMILVPEYQDKVLPHLEQNANNAAKSCSGGDDGKTCGQDWSKDGWDGQYGLGEEMSALDVIMNTKVTQLGKPGTNPTTNTKPTVPKGQDSGVGADGAVSDASSEGSSQSSSHSSTEFSTEASTKSSIESSTQSSTESSTEASTEASSTSEASTEVAATESSSQESTANTGDATSTVSSSEPLSTAEAFSESSSESSSSSTQASTTASSSESSSESSSSSRPSSRASSSSSSSLSSGSSSSSSSSRESTSASPSSSEVATTVQATSQASSSSASNAAGSIAGSWLSFAMVFML